MFGQRDSLYMSKLRTYQPIDTTEIDRDVEYEVVLKHYSVDEGSVIRRDTVAGYAADYLRQLILDAERDSVNLKSFLEVHFGNFKNVNTEYFNIKNYLTALRNAATGRPMERQTPLEPAVEKQYIGRVIMTQSAYSSDSLIIGATYIISPYISGDDFTNVGGQNYTGNVFQATGEYPGVWVNGSELLFEAKDTTLTSGTLELGKIYNIDASCCGDDFSNLYELSDSIFYHSEFMDFGYLYNYYLANEQPVSWTNSTQIRDRNILPIVYKNDLGLNVSIYKQSDALFLIYSDLPIFNNTEYSVEVVSNSLNFSSSKALFPANKNVAYLKDLDANPIRDIYLKITKFIQP